MGVQSIIGPIIHCDDSGDLVIHENVQIDIRDGKVYVKTNFFFYYKIFFFFKPKMTLILDRKRAFESRHE